MFLTLSFRDLEALSTYELRSLHTKIINLLRHSAVDDREQQAFLRIEGNIRLLLARRTSRPYLGL